MKDEKVRERGWARASVDRYGLLKDFAKANRREMTEAEQVLWNAIRYKALGVSFRRQVIIGDYIADFACLAQKLIIEVDGGYHSTESQIQEDELRTQVLNRLGFRVIRFGNDEVMYDTEEVLNTIRKHIVIQ
ncbi:MAG: endonuclease domain-containing protein [Bacteroidaceae bacterium]|nr:endonuclease domain-containing protein [Bacteroidaceae bacterium]